MKILFIGGTGNISLSVSRAVLALGHQLTLFNRRGAAELPEAECLVGDIGDAAATAALLRGRTWDAVVNWVAFTAADVERDIKLFDGRTGQYVFISSASCYDATAARPWITEETPLYNPHWEYSRAKITAERRLLAAHRERRFPVTIVRPSLTYDRVIPLSIGGWLEYTTCARIKAGKPIVVPGDGTSLWTITHAEDFARGFVGLLGLPAALGEAVHITSDEVLSWNAIYEQTAAALGKRAHIVHVTSDQIVATAPDYEGTLLGDKSVSALFDNSKIKRLVPQFRCEIPYADGIARTLAWFEQEPARRRINRDTDALIERLLARFDPHHAP